MPLLPDSEKMKMWKCQNNVISQFETFVDREIFALALPDKYMHVPGSCSDKKGTHCTHSYITVCKMTSLHFVRFNDVSMIFYLQ